MALHEHDIAEQPHEGWRDLRRREWLRWLVILSFLPGSLLIMVGVSLLRDDVPDHFAVWIAGGWIGTLLAVDFHRRRFRCEYCRRLFHRRRDHRRVMCCADCDLLRDG